MKSDYVYIFEDMAEQFGRPHRGRISVTRDT